MRGDVCSIQHLDYSFTEASYYNYYKGDGEMKQKLIVLLLAIIVMLCLASCEKARQSTVPSASANKDLMKATETTQLFYRN